MKRFEKILAFAFAMIFAFSMVMPASAMYSGNLIDKITINIDPKIAGKTVNDYEDYIEFTAKNALDEETDKLKLENVRIWDVEKGCYISEGEKSPATKLEAGKNYRFDLWFIADEGCVINDEIEPYITVTCTGYSCVLGEEEREEYAGRDYMNIRLTISVDEPNLNLFGKIAQAIKNFFESIVNFFKYMFVEK